METIRHILFAQLTLRATNVLTIHAKENPVFKLRQFLMHLGQQSAVLQPYIGADQTGYQPRCRDQDLKNVVFQGSLSRM